MKGVDIQQFGADFLIHKYVVPLGPLKDQFFYGLFHKNPLSFPLINMVLLSIILLFIIRFVLRFRKSLLEESVLLELTPPAYTDKTAYTTEQLFSVIHGLGKRRTFFEKVLGIKTMLSFEIVSTEENGIRYLLRTAPQQTSNVKRYLLSYLPQVSVKTTDDYLSNNNGNQKIVEFKLSRKFPYPLKRQDELEEHDPVAYITGMMTKLSKGELISFQIVASPAKPPEARTLKRMILRNEDVLEYLDRNQTPSYIKPLGFIFNTGIKLMGVIARESQWAVTEFFHPNTQTTYMLGQRNFQQEMQIQQNIRPARVLSNFELEAVKSVQEKIGQPLFETTLRLLVRVSENDERGERVDGFLSSLEIFSVPGYQSLVKKRGLPDFMWKKVRMFTFQKRLLSLLNNKSSSLLSASEIADLYHFPFSRVTQTENIVKVHSKELPAPLSLKGERQFDVVIGKNTYGGTTTKIGLTEEEREKHVYIIGATGVGKTTMLQSMIKQDIENGKGACVVDPHGDLAESLINFVPDKRKNDFMYFNPDDIKYPIGLNLLELTPGLDEDELLREKELITESVVSLFRKIFSEVWSAHAHRLEYILRNTIQTALCLKDPTIFTVYKLLTDPQFQESAMNDVDDENLVDFWKNEYGKAGDFQKVKMIGPITSRIGRFLFSPSAKRILEQTKSTINFDDILDNGKILICNLSKGKISEDTSEVLGIMILAKIQLTSLKRARIAQINRRPFYLYVDEFQNFATPSFIQMLSESRKYKVFLTMAEQSTSQQKDRNIVNVILANVGTVISFRSANPDDEKLMLPQFAPYVEKGEIHNLPKYRFYIKISAVSPEEAFSGITILAEFKVSKKKAELLIGLSRENYAIVYIKPQPVKKQIKKKSVNDSDRGLKDMDDLT